MFLMRYLATGIIGTLTIYYGAPQLKPLLMSGDGGGTAGAMAFESALPAQTASQDQRTPADPVVSATVPPRKPQLASSVADRAVTTKPAAAGSTGVPVVINTLGYTPSTRRIPASGADTTHWGVTLLAAPLFERDGKRRHGVLPGGTLVEQVDAMNSSRGEVANCRVWQQNGWEGPWLIATADLIRFKGGRDEVDADELDLLCRYGALYAQQDARHKELARLAVDANPHAAPLRQLKQRYDAAAARAKSLTQQRDNAQGNVRIRLGDELRQLKEDEVKMRREIEALKQKYEMWKRNAPPSIADPARDPQLRDLAAQLEALRPQLGNFGL